MRATINVGEITLRLDPAGFANVVEKHLKVRVTESGKPFEVRVPYRTSRAQRGAVKIEPAGPRDIFDLPPAKLKKLVQGIVWRDEHFAGASLKEIAAREGCSKAYVGKIIFESLEAFV